MVLIARSRCYLEATKYEVSSQLYESVIYGSRLPHCGLFPHSLLIDIIRDTSWNTKSTLFLKRVWGCGGALKLPCSQSYHVPCGYFFAPL